MSALNVSRALPAAVNADAGSSKAQGMEGDSGFADVFRDLTRASGDADGKTASDARSDQAPSDAQNQTGSAKADTGNTFSLADALASASSKRSADAGKTLTGEASGNPASVQQATTDGQLNGQLLQTSTADTTSLPSTTPDAGSLGQQDEETASTNKDGSTSARADSDRLARNRRAANEGLNRLLFGSKDGLNGLSAATKPATLTDDDIRSATADQPPLLKAAQADASSTEDTAAANSAENTASTALPDPAALALQDLARFSTPATDTDAGTEGADTSSSSNQLIGQVDAEPQLGKTDSRTLSVSVLSRETHFAPIRTIAMNGGSAPTTETAATTKDESQTAAPQITLGAATTSRETRASAGLRGTEPGRGTMPLNSATVKGGDTQRADAETEGLTAKSDSASVETADAVRSSGGRQGSRADDRSSDKSAQQNDTTAALTSGAAARADVKQGETRDVSLSSLEVNESLPVTGTAGIAPTNGVATPNLPALQQIGAAIAAEANAMDGGTTAVASADSASAQVLAGPVRILQIQLKPDELGTVNVRMRLSGGALEIQLRASNPETAKMLANDRTALSDLLTASGITAESITIVGIDGGSSQLTGQDAGRSFGGEASAQQAESRDSTDQNGRGSQNDDSQKGGRDDEARSRSRSADAGVDFRV